MRFKLKYLLLMSHTYLEKLIILYIPELMTHLYTCDIKKKINKRYCICELLYDCSVFHHEFKAIVIISQTQKMKKKYEFKTL